MRGQHIGGAWAREKTHAFAAAGQIIEACNQPLWVGLYLLTALRSRADGTRVPPTKAGKLSLGVDRRRQTKQRRSETHLASRRLLTHN